MEVNVKKKKFEIKPNGITIDGKARLKLNLIHNDGATVIPNEETDYKIEWSTSGTYGLFRGLTSSQTVTNESSIIYIAQDTEVESGTETFQAQIYAKPKNSDEPYKLADQAKATIKIENDENKIIFYRPFNVRTVVFDPTQCTGATITAALISFAPVEDAESYSVTIFKEGW